MRSIPAPAFVLLLPHGETGGGMLAEAGVRAACASQCGAWGRASACPALVAPRPAPRPVLPLALSTVKAPFAFVNNNPMQSFCNKQIQTIAPCIPRAQRQDPRKTPPATSNSPEGPRGQGGIRQPVLCHTWGGWLPLIGGRAAFIKGQAGI